MRHFYIYSFVFSKEQIHFSYLTEEGAAFWRNYVIR